MPRTAKALTLAVIRAAKPSEKAVKLSDGGGMYLLLNPDGARYWRLDYRFGGKRKTLALGVFPQVSLSVARERRAAARALLGRGIDPATVQQRGKRATRSAAPARVRSHRSELASTINAIQLTRRQLLLQIIADVSEILISSADEHVLMHTICEALVHERLFRVAWIGMTEPGGTLVTPIACAGITHKALELADIRYDASPQGQSPIGMAIRLGKTVVTTPEQTQIWHGWGEHAEMRSSAATPIRRQERCVGALTVYSDEVQAFGADEVILLEKLATDLSIAIEHRSAERALRESEAKFRLILDASPEAIFGVDTKGICTFVNPACLSMLGYTQESDLVGKALHPLIHHHYPDGRPYPREECNLRRSTQRGECMHVDNEVHWRADGSCFPVEYWSRPIYRDGSLVGAVVNFIDITERKRAEQALRESEERYRLISSVATDLLYSCVRGADGGFVIDWATVPAAEIFGYTLQEILDQGCWRCYVHPDDVPVFDEHITQLQPGQASECELRIIAKDGSLRYLRAYSRVVEMTPVDAATPAAHRLYGACQDITERMLAKERIRYLAHHDALTGLPNRILLRDRFKQAIQHAERDQTNVAMLFMDLDNFKIVNDTLGHIAGDKLLQSVVGRISRCVRETDTICRQGGDEFILLMSDIGEIETVERVAGMMLAMLAEPIEIDGRSLTTSCSIGISLYPADGKDFDVLLQKADAAMYNAKDAGRNTYRFFSTSMNLRAHEHMLLQGRLHRALQLGEFSILYQPQLAVGSGRIVGVEALLRWHSPELGEVSPERFIPVAEDSGSIVQIGAWVMQEACRQAQCWHAEGYPDLTVSVNLSALQFRRGNIVEIVAQALQASGLEPGCLELELTESVLLQDVDKALLIVGQLKALGVCLSIDDFGTGYSSLSYLKRLTVDRLKIDQSFIRDIGVDQDDEAIVRAIIQMARSLRLRIIAEGVENQRQYEFLRHEGCEEIQGYYLSYPLPPSAVPAFLREHAGVAE